MVLVFECAQAFFERVDAQAQGGVFSQEQFVLAGELLDLAGELVDVLCLALDDGDEHIGLRTQAIEKIRGDVRIHELSKEGKRR